MDAPLWLRVAALTAVVVLIIALAAYAAEWWHER
jgi:hypothetical protein